MVAEQARHGVALKGGLGDVMRGEEGRVGDKIARSLGGLKQHGVGGDDGGGVIESGQGCVDVIGESGVEGGFGGVIRVHRDSELGSLFWREERDIDEN